MNLNEVQIYILLPVHNRRVITLEFIATLKMQTVKNYQLILIDDGSTDETADAVVSELPSTHVIRGDGNLWWAGSLQVGIDFLKESKINPNSIVLIINDDTHIPEKFLEIGTSLIINSKNKIFCAQSISLQTGKVADAGVKIDWFKYQFLPAKSEAEINCLSTRGLFLRFSDVIKIGEFIPKFLPHYYSDYEFTVRAGRRGYQLCSPRELTLTMNESTTGTHSVENLSLRAYFKKAFQVRSAINPWAAAKFISVAAPVKYRFICYFRLFVYFSKCIVKATLNGL